MEIFIFLSHDTQAPIVATFIMTARFFRWSDALRSYHHSTAAQVAYLAESQVGRVMAKDVGQSGFSDRYKHIVRSPEGGNNDFGIVVSPEFFDDFRGNDLDRFMSLVNSEKEVTVIPLDVKSLMPTTTFGTAIPVVHLTPQQVDTCQALIIIIPADPNFVALLPVYYFHQREKTSHKAGTEYYFSGVRVSWTLHPLPTFPPELTPFVLPFSGLGQAVADIQDYSMGLTTEW